MLDAVNSPFDIYSRIDKNDAELAISLADSGLVNVSRDLERLVVEVARNNRNTFLKFFGSVTQHYSDELLNLFEERFNLTEEERHQVSSGVNERHQVADKISEMVEEFIHDRNKELSPEILEECILEIQEMLRSMSIKKESKMWCRLFFESMYSSVSNFHPEDVSELLTKYIGKDYADSYNNYYERQVKVKELEDSLRDKRQAEEIE